MTNAARDGEKEKVIFAHTLQAFIQRVIMRRALLSIEFDKELRALGVDVSRPKEVNLATWVALLRACAKKMSPGAPEDEALEQVGREMMQGYSEGLVGRAMTIVLKLIGPRRSLLRMMENYATADNMTTVKVVEVTPTTMELEFNSTGDMPTYVRGILSEMLRTVGARDIKIDYRTLPSSATVYSVSWT